MWEMAPSGATSAERRGVRAFVEVNVETAGIDVATISWKGGREVAVEIDRYGDVSLVLTVKRSGSF